MNDPVEVIVQAYVKTRMTVTQFEKLVRDTLEAVKQEASKNAIGGGDYDKGFSDGYDSCLAEHKLAE